MKISDFEKLEKVNSEPSMLLVEIEEKFLFDRLVDNISKKHGLRIIRYSARDFEFRDLVMELDTIDIFNEPKLYIISEISFWKENEFKFEELYLDNNRILFIVDRKKGAYKSISKKVQTLNITRLNREELKDLVKSIFKEHNREIENSMLTYLIDASGYLKYKSNITLYNVYHELIKIFSKGNTITKSDIDRYFQDLFIYSTFELQNRLLENKKKDSFRMLYKFYEQADDLNKQLSQLILAIYELQVVKILTDSGIGNSKIKEFIGAQSDYRVEKLISQTFNFSLDELIQMQEELLKATSDSRKYPSDIDGVVESVLLKLTI